MDKRYFMDWLEKRIEDTLKFKPKDEMNTAFIYGATTVMNEILKQVNDGKFDDNKK